MSIIQSRVRSSASPSGAARTSRFSSFFFRQGRNRRRGNGVLEAALVMPVLFSISMGAIEFGYFLYAKHMCQSASRDGARKAILASSTQSATVQAVTDTMASGKLTTSQYTLTFTDALFGTTITDVATCSKGTGIKVTVSTTAGTVNVRPLALIPASKQIVGVTTMVKE